MTTTKGFSLKPLETAQALRSNLELAHAQLEGFLRDTLQAYIDFLPERGPNWAPSKYTAASDYTFKEIDGENFAFESDEFYEYGEYSTDYVNLPFAFIDDPEKFKAETLQAIRDSEAKRTAKNREAAEARVANLKRQLEVAERSLEKAE